MKLLVFMKDGRTVYMIEKRGVLSELCRDEPWHEQPGATVVKGIWNPTTGEYLWQRNVRLRFLAKGSISHVEEDHGQHANEPVRS